MIRPDKTFVRPGRTALQPWLHAGCRIRINMPRSCSTSTRAEREIHGREKNPQHVWARARSISNSRRRYRSTSPTRRRLWDDAGAPCSSARTSMAAGRRHGCPLLRSGRNRESGECDRTFSAETMRGAARQRAGWAQVCQQLVVVSGGRRSFETAVSAGLLRRRLPPGPAAASSSGACMNR